MQRVVASRCLPCNNNTAAVLDVIGMPFIRQRRLFVERPSAVDWGSNPVTPVAWVRPTRGQIDRRCSA